MAPNPINTLPRIVGELKDRHGHITIPGFYDAVVRPSAEELTDWKKKDARYAETVKRRSGARAPEGEEGFLGSSGRAAGPPWMRTASWAGSSAKARKP